MKSAGAFLAAACCCAAQWGSIASDAARVSQSEARGFLEAICPGHATDKRCSVCPEEMPPSAQTWDLRTITFGHFLAAGSEDALVAGLGCEPHASLMSGAYLFTKEGSSWRKVWYSSGQNADDCKKLAGADGRDRLICEASDMHQGFADQFLYLTDAGRDPRKPGYDPLAMFFDVTDSIRSCAASPEGNALSGEIASVSFVPAPAPPGVRIVVTARLGQAGIPSKIMEKCQPGGKGAPIIATVTRRYEFLFDGSKVVPGAGNPPIENTRAVAPKTSYRTAKPTLR
jgi:hypothetical protein